MTKEDILNILIGKTPPEENLFNYIKRLSLKDITYILDSGKDKFRDFFSERQNEFRFLFFRLRKLIPEYNAFSKYINAHMLPTLEFYEFASKELIFYEPESKPLVFFSHITKDTWEPGLYDSSLPEVTFNNIKNNINQMLCTLNPDYSERKINDLCHDMFARIFNSKLKYFDADRIGEYILSFNLHKKPISPKEIGLFSAGFEIARFSDFTLPFADVYGEETKLVSDKEIYQILDNYLAIAGNNFTKINKFILSISALDSSKRNRYLEYFISGYEKAAGIKYPFRKYNDKNELDSSAIVLAIMEFYINGLIEGRISKPDIKVMICDLINANYDSDELDKIIKRVEQVLFQNHNEYLLLYYQALLTQRISYDKDIELEDVRYSTIMDEDGRFDQEIKTITYFLFSYAMDEPEEIIPTAIEVVNHEMRHAYQDSHMHYKISIPSLLSDLESMICAKPTEGKTADEEYEERYDKNYFESDARVYAFFSTYKKLRQLSSSSAENFFVESANEDPIINKAARTYLDSVRGKLSENVKDMKSLERFFFLITELYNRFDTRLIADYRRFSASLRAITREDGSLLSLNEIRKIIDESKDHYLRYFYINYARKYELCINQNDIFQMGESINR